MVLRDDRKGKGRDRDLREKEQSKVLEDDRKEKGRRRMAYLTHAHQACEQFDNRKFVCSLHKSSNLL